jgi:ribosomal protein L40E
MGIPEGRLADECGAANEAAAANSRSCSSTTIRDPSGLST